MRRFLAVLLAVAVSFVSLGLARAEGSPAGTTCPSLGQALVFDGVAYKCIKSGSKLVWDGGVSLANKFPKISAPKIVGAPAVGNTLQAVVAPWGKSVEYQFTWIVGNKVVTGEKDRSYVVRKTDLGKAIKVKVVGSAPGYESAERFSIATKLVVKSNVKSGVSAGSSKEIKVYAVPVISGAPRAADVVEVALGKWEQGVKFSYQWLSDGQPVDGATNYSLRIPGELEGAQLSVKVVASKTGFKARTLTSKPVLVIEPWQVSDYLPTPTVSGATKVGGEVKASTGDWKPDPLLTYTSNWYACAEPVTKATLIPPANCSKLSGTDSLTYSPTLADKGKYLSYGVTVFRAGESYTSTSASVQKLPTLVAGGNLHSCSLSSNGSIDCWGNNGEGQLGVGDRQNRFSPTKVLGLTNATHVEAGSLTTCAVESGGAVYCWGESYRGKLGIGTFYGSSIVPIQVQGLDPAEKVTVGVLHACALSTSGKAACWGDNLNGQLGAGLGYAPNVITSVPGIPKLIDIGAGYFHTCALDNSGIVWCWGSNAQGQLGNTGIPKFSQQRAVQVQGINDATQIAVGNSHTCALLKSRSVLCWGKNSHGELGDGTTTDSTIPVSVKNLSGVTHINAGENHTCALLEDSSVKCWGWNDYGQLGDLSQTNSSLPVSVFGLKAVVQLALGRDHTLALTSDGTVFSWGSNVTGQLGNNSTDGGLARRIPWGFDVVN